MSPGRKWNRWDDYYDDYYYDDYYDDEYYDDDYYDDDEYYDDDYEDYDGSGGFKANQIGLRVTSQSD